MSHSSLPTASLREDIERLFDAGARAHEVPMAHPIFERFREALTHGENALLDESGRLAALTIEVLRDPELRDRLGAAGRRPYESRFTPEKAGARIVEERERIARPAPDGAAAPR